MLVLFLFDVFREAMDDHDLLVVVPEADPGPGPLPRGGNSFPIILLILLLKPKIHRPKA